VRGFLTNFDKQKSHLPTPDSISTLLKKMDNLKETKPYFIKGAALESFKNEMIPTVTRRLRLMKTTMVNLQRAKTKGETLLEYLDKKH